MRLAPAATASWQRAYKKATDTGLLSAPSKARSQDHSARMQLAQEVGLLCGVLRGAGAVAPLEGLYIAVCANGVSAARADQPMDELREEAAGEHRGQPGAEIIARRWLQALTLVKLGAGTLPISAVDGNAVVRTSPHAMTRDQSLTLSCRAHACEGDFLDDLGEGGQMAEGKVFVMLGVSATASVSLARNTPLGAELRVFYAMCQVYDPRRWNHSVPIAARKCTPAFIIPLLSPTLNRPARHPPPSPTQCRFTNWCPPATATTSTTWGGRRSSRTGATAPFSGRRGRAAGTARV